MTQEQTPLLSLRELHKTFPKGFWGRRQTAVNTLSIDFPAGQTTGLLGHNGAGKTTVMRLILGLMRPDRGEILFQGTPLSIRDKSFIGYMPEIDKLSMNLTPMETLDFHLRLFGHRGRLRGAGHRGLIEDALHTVELWDHRRKRLGAMSKGMRRRLAWAVATIHRPDLVILDEPFSGLDPMGRRQMEGWMRDLKKDGVTMVLSTHEIWTMKSLCDHIHILRQGSLVHSTLNPVEGQVAMDQRAGLFVLRVSGVDEKSLRAIAAMDTLPAWVSLRQQGLLASMEFEHYTDAARWLRSVLERGHLVAGFGDADQGSFADDDRFLQMFRGGDVC